MLNVGEIRIFPYDDLPIGYLECDGRKLEINKYPKLYMMIGRKYGYSDDKYFSLPNLKEKISKDIKYCIAYKGEIPKLEGENYEKDNN